MSTEQAAKVLGVDPLYATDVEIETGRNFQITIWNDPDKIERVNEAYDSLLGFTEKRMENATIFGQELLTSPSQQKMMIEEEKSPESFIDKNDYSALIRSLQENLDKKENQKCSAINIQVSTNLRKEMAAGNYLYRTVSPEEETILETPTSLLINLRDKVNITHQSLELMEKVQQKVAELSDDTVRQLATFYREYPTYQDAFPTVLNDSVFDKVQEFWEKQIATSEGSFHK